MSATDGTATVAPHGHVFLGETHERSERRTWAVIGLCGAMMVLEIAGGLFFGSIALVADGLHMSTHAGALLLAALAYTYARRHAQDRRFTFGTGKIGDLAGFSSAIVLAVIAIIIGVEAVGRLFSPVAIHFREAIPIAGLGLAVNLASAWLLGGGDHDHRHGHSHDDHHHDHDRHHDHADGHGHADRHGHAHGGSVQRDNNMRAALIHVAADAAVSVLVIVGLLLASAFGWTWMDPLAGLAGALVIASWSWNLVCDTAAVLLDVNPEPELARQVKVALEAEGDVVADLHLWRLGPGHLGAIASVVTAQGRDAGFYRNKLSAFPALSHLTVEVGRR